mgnify:CR=1 FL=1
MPTDSLRDSRMYRLIQLCIQYILRSTLLVVVVAPARGVYLGRSVGYVACCGPHPHSKINTQQPVLLCSRPPSTQLALGGVVQWRRVVKDGLIVEVTVVVSYSRATARYTIPF